MVLATRFTNNFCVFFLILRMASPSMNPDPLSVWKLTQSTEERPGFNEHHQRKKRGWKKPLIKQPLCLYLLMARQPAGVQTWG